MYDVTVQDEELIVTGMNAVDSIGRGQADDLLFGARTHLLTSLAVAQRRFHNLGLIIYIQMSTTVCDGDIGEVGTTTRILLVGFRRLHKSEGVEGSDVLPW